MLAILIILAQIKTAPTSLPTQVPTRVVPTAAPYVGKTPIFRFNTPRPVATPVKK